MFEIENVIRLYVENEGGVHLELCPNPDAPDFGVLIHTTNDKSEKWFGKVYLTLTPEECKVLGDALIDMSERIGE